MDEDWDQKDASQNWKISTSASIFFNLEFNNFMKSP